MWKKLIVLMLLIGLTDAFSISTSTNEGSIGSNFEMGENSDIYSEISLGENGIFESTKFSGKDITIEKNIANKEKSASYILSSSQGTLESTSAASDDGIYGKVDHNEAGTIIAPEQIEFWAENPEIVEEAQALTYSGAVLHYTSGQYYDGSDPTNPWHTHGLTMYCNIQDRISPDGYQLKGLDLIYSVANGMNQWNNKDGNVNEQAFTKLIATYSSSANYGSGYNGVSGISYSSLPTGITGKTTVWYNSGTRHLVEADIGFNSNYGWLFNNQQNRDQVALHELGHVVGLKDFQDPRSVMYYQFVPGGYINWDTEQIWKYKVNY